jgi:hypothetical protein
MEALRRRSLLRMGEGDLERAWADLDDVVRIARLVDQVPRPEWQTVATSAMTRSFMAECRAAIHFRLPWEKARARCQRIRQPIGLTPLANRADRSGRTAALQKIAVTAQLRRGDLLLPAYGLPKCFGDCGAFAVWALADWTVVFIELNRYFDILVEALRAPNSAVRDARGKRLADIIRREIADHNEIATYFRAALRLQLRQRLAKAVAVNWADRMVNRSYGYASQRWHEELRLAVWQDLCCLSYAIAAYHRDNGANPKSLEDLAPNYLKSIPLDRFTNRPLNYCRVNGKLYLFSAGPNGKAEFNGEWYGDDVVTRVE